MLLLEARVGLSLRASAILNPGASFCYESASSEFVEMSHYSFIACTV